MGFIALWFISPFITLWNIPKIAAYKDKQQKERLEEIDPELAKIVVTGESTGDLGFFLRKSVGIDIRNKTSEDFDCNIELIGITIYEVDGHCDEHPSDHPVDISNCHFPAARIKGGDHAVINIAALRDSIGEEKGAGMVLLTENPTSLVLLEMLFIVSDFESEPDFAKMYFEIEFEIRGQLGSKFFSQKFSTLITLRSEVISRNNDKSLGMRLGSRNIQSTIEIGEVIHE